MFDYKSCSFTGHRIIKNENEIRKKLRETVIYLIENENVKTFINGGAIGFDMLSAEEILDLKKYYDIELKMILPCTNQDEKWKNYYRERYRTILKNADEVIYVCDKYENGCMQRRNRKMVEESDIVLGYCERRAGGTYFTMSYAEKLNKKIINIAK